MFNMSNLFLSVLLLPAFVLAGENQAPRNLTLDQAVLNVLERNPLLKAAGIETEVAAAQMRSARLPTPFNTSIEFENFAGNDSNSGIDVLETTLSLSKVLERGNKSALRGEVAQTNALLLRNDQDAKRLDLLAETTKRFIHIVTNQERLTIAKASLVLAQRTQSVANRRVKAGKSHIAELRKAKIDVAHKTLALQHAEHVLASSRVKLVTLWGEIQPDFTDARADLFSIETARPFDDLVVLLERNPDLVRYATDERLAQTKLKLAESNRRTDIEITGGIRHFNKSDDAGFVLSFDIPLGNSSRASSQVEEAEAQRLHKPYLHKAKHLALHATLFEVYQEIMHAVNAVKVLQETIIPQATRALRDYEKGYAAGRYSFLELTEAQRTLIDSKLEAVMAAADFHRYHIEIDRLTGAGLVAGANP
jgi:cobalt-zinc-cadmium efflux system outer membrane protein